MPDIIEKKRAFETYQTTVSLTESLSPHVKRIHFQYPVSATMAFRAGQFVQIFVLDPDKTAPHLVLDRFASLRVHLL